MLALQNSPSTALTERDSIPRWESPIATYAELTEPRERVLTISGGAGTYKVVFRASSLPAWVQPTISAFVGIQKLPSNWDLYGGKVINRDLIKQALYVLGMIMREDSPVPSIVPLGDGGIQIEWHRKHQDLEVVFAADEAPQFYYRSRSTSVEHEGSANEHETLTRLLSDLV